MYSRLVLCKTYRLDEDGKVLTPEEILYRVSIAWPKPISSQERSLLIHRA